MKETRKKTKLYKPLTKDQVELFKKMWQDDYTYMEIFDAIGQPYDYLMDAVKRGMNYRKKLGLPKRHKTSWHYTQAKTKKAKYVMLRINHLNARKKHLQEMIIKMKQTINKYQIEIANIDKEVMSQ